MTVQALRNIYQIKVTLKDTTPPIWRRLRVQSDIKLKKLHVALQIALGWTDSHMHQFISGSEYYGTPDPDFDFDCKPESKAKLDDLLKKEKASIIYEYDFGDGWEHKIVLEKILPFTKDFKAPVCLKGVGACPPEDCGGPYGYRNLLEVLSNSSHPEHAEMVEWLGCDDFDPNFFDIDDVNEGLKINCRC
ncbi:MAG: plasmid pRiA4b ORF-3 family protein [Deltaproteobacteria bacterium]|nr:plasmid pRiA4b ORF-3 family protein [Deltaproteobacteria bacterium]